MRSNHSGGFTLIEVLLSGLILFVTIASMTSVYRGAILASEKSENSLDMSAAMHAVRRVVTDNFRYGDFLGEPGGQGSHGEIDYSWSAEITHKGTLLGSPDGSTSEREFSLWNVDITLNHGRAVRTYSFSEIKW